jgi:hypothetical protein
VGQSSPSGHPEVLPATWDCGCLKGGVRGRLGVAPRILETILMSVRLPSRRLVVAGIVGTLAVTSFLMTGLMADAAAFQAP